MSPSLRRCAVALLLFAGCGSRTGLLDESVELPDAQRPQGRCAPVRVPDFNGDGFSDFAIVTRAGVMVYYGRRGEIPAAPTRVIPLPTGVTADTATVSFVGDLDGDGTSELALSRRSAQVTVDLPDSPFRAGDLFIAMGSRAGLVSTLQRVIAPGGYENNFPSQVFYAGTYASATRDAFVVTLTAGRGAFVFTRSEDGAFSAQSAAPLESGDGGAYAAVFARGAGDVDGDGRGDLAVATDGVGILYSAGARRVLYTDPSNRVGPYLDGVGDVTRDGCNDLLLLSFAERGSLSVFAGGPGFGARTPWTPRAPNGRAVAFNGTTDYLPVGDVDGDGAADVLLYGTCLSGAPCADGVYERWLYRGGATGLSETPLVMPSMSSRSFTQHPLGDLDGDGRAELGEYLRGAAQLTVWRGTAMGYVTTARVTITPPDLMGASASFTGSVP
jgi:FG-GAP-like repeat